MFGKLEIAMAFALSLVNVAVPSARAAEADVIDATLIGGRLARTGEVPAGVWTGRCSATIIGPRILLTAAHCTTTGATLRFTYRGQSYSARMENHPLYSVAAGYTHDISLGLIDRAVVGAEPATLSERTLAIGDAIVHTGFGCTFAGGAPDGIMRLGFSTVTELWETDYVTASPGTAVLCSGDSGGSAYEPFQSDGSFTNRIVAVNSKSDRIAKSYVTRLDLQTSQNFFADYLARVAASSPEAAAICGFNMGCE